MEGYTRGIAAAQPRQCCTLCFLAVTQLQLTLAAVQELLIQQQQKIQELSQELTTSKASNSTNTILESQNIQELKSEIYSLKGLLLNR
ncbi:hypothetical protein FKM82_026245 [Ascaphus truei]